MIQNIGDTIQNLIGAAIIKGRNMMKFIIRSLQILKTAIEILAAGLEIAHVLRHGI